MGSRLDSVVITSITENYVDMLLADTPKVRRAGLIHHFDPKRTPILGENGIALHVEVNWGPYSYRVLFDTGMTGRVLLGNAEALGLDLGAVDHIVISHGHPDHYGALADLLIARGAAVPIALNGGAFLPRYLRLATGQVAPYYNHDLTEARLWDIGGRPVLHRGPLEVGPGMIATGEIPREVDFERPSNDITTPNALIQLVDGEMKPDTVPDDQALVIEVGTDGIIVLVGCSHAGIINTIRHAIKITGRERVVGVLGGFHLGFPGTPPEKTLRTIEALKDMQVETICPMHCTGMPAIIEIGKAFPDQFVLGAAGTRFTFE